MEKPPLENLAESRIAAEGIEGRPFLEEWQKHVPFADGSRQQIKRLLRAAEMSGLPVVCQYIRIDILYIRDRYHIMATKSEQLQIRVTPSEKTALKRLAKQAGEDVSSYVLARALPPQQRRFAELVRALERSEDRRFALAELNDMLSQSAATDFPRVVESCDLRGLSDFARNYLAAMVERAAEQRNIGPPRWVHDVTPLDTPWFASQLKNLRLHLLRTAPVAFKRRNLFVDSSVGDRV